MLMPRTATELKAPVVEDTVARIALVLLNVESIWTESPCPIPVFWSVNRFAPPAVAGAR